MSKEDGLTHSESRSNALTREPTREEKTREAIDEGHDADIPSNIGFVPTPGDEHRRRQSLASQRRVSHARDRGSLDHEKHNKEDASVRDAEEGSQTQSESDVVWWDGDKDRQNPYNFASWKKVLNCTLVSALTFVTPLASCKWFRSLICLRSHSHTRRNMIWHMKSSS
jgi:hypothetical protein